MVLCGPSLRMSASVGKADLVRVPRHVKSAQKRTSGGRLAFHCRLDPPLADRLDESLVVPVGLIGIIHGEVA